MLGSLGDTDICANEDNLKRLWERYIHKYVIFLSHFVSRFGELCSTDVSVLVTPSHSEKTHKFTQPSSVPVGEKCNFVCF